MNQEKEKSRNNSSAWAWAAAVIWLTKGGVPDTLLQLQPEKPTVHLITARPNQFLMEGWRGSQREREREGGQKNALRERRRCCSSRGWRIDKMVTVEDTLLVPLKAPFISFYWVTFTSKHLCLFVWGSAQCEPRCIEIAICWLSVCEMERRTQPSLCSSSRV